jgi:polar amino acid transport system substrate-binding protein
VPAILRRALVLLAAALAIVLPVAPSSGDDALAQIKARGSVIVGIKVDYPPFGFLDGDRNAGLEIDLLRIMAKDLLGKPDAIAYVPVVAANRFQFLSTGKVDFLFATVSVTDQRRAVVDFSAPYMKSGWQMLVKRGDHAISDVKDLKDKTVIVPPGSIAEAGIRRLAPDARLLRLTQTSEALQALDEGRADAFAQDSALLVGIAKANPAKYAIVGASYDQAPIAAACRKGDSAPCDYITKEIARFRRDGTLSKTFRRWLGAAAPRFEP